MTEPLSSPFPYEAQRALNSSLDAEGRHTASLDYQNSQVWSAQKRRSESWKYLPFQESLSSQYQEGDLPQNFDLNAFLAQSNSSQDETSENRLTLYTVNGHLCLEHLPDTLPTGIQIFAQSDPRFVDLQLHSDQDPPLHPLHSLNRARAQDGWVIYIDSEAPLTHLWIEHLLVQEEELHSQALITHPRVLIYLTQGSKASVVESFVGEGDTSTCINAVCEIHLCPQSRLNYLKLQNQSLSTQHFGTHLFYLADSAWCEGIFLNLGASLTRFDLDAHLKGQHAQIHLKGLFTGSQKQVLDQHLTLHHHQPNCQSTQHFKGILNHKAQGIFTGKVYVAPGAFATNAQQNNPNLILNHKARVMTRPQLEIYNDDVECSHGATVGQLDDDALFYLQSRGLSYDVAVAFLTTAFASQIQKEILFDQVKDQCTLAIERTLGEHAL